MMARINHIGISGGKDSTALLLWAVHESGYAKESIIASFADTGNEANETYAYVQMLSERVHPIQIIKPPLDFYELAFHKKRFPSACARFCTQELKMKPTKAYIDSLLAEGGEVLMHSGVRALESDDRSKLPPHENATMSYFGCPLFRPLLYWTLQDVWAIHARYGISPNPLYGMGMSRVGCLPCIMSRRKEVAKVKMVFPARIDMIRGKERSMPNHCGYSSMFARDKVPERYRSKLVQASPKKVKGGICLDKATIRLFEAEDIPMLSELPGQAMNVATIDDVVRWALNDPALYQQDFSNLEEVDFGEDAPACDSRYGACE